MTGTANAPHTGQKTPHLLDRPLPALCMAFVLGAASTLAMAPYEIAPVLFITLGGLYALLSRRESRRSIFACAWAFGFGYFVFGLSWIGNALLVDGNEYAWAYPLAIAALPSVLAFFSAVLLTIWRRSFDPLTLSGYLGFAACLGLSEWLRGNIFTGFPWNLFGYAWAGFLPIAQVAALADVYLLTLLTILWSAAFGFIPLYKATQRKKIITALTIASSFAAAMLYGYSKLGIEIGTRDDIDIVLVQPNIPQSEKWLPELFSRHFNTHLDLTESQGLTAGEGIKSTYVIWPETAIPLAFTHHPDAAEMIAQTLSYFPEQTFLLAGAVARPDKDAGQTDSYYNSLVTYDKAGKIVSKFDKFHLVPFGEYIPYEDELGLTPITGLGGFGSGPGPKTLSVEPAFSFSPLVCYEIIFPRAVTDESVGAKRPDALINVTNDGWYGISAGPFQHLAQARFRAIEEGIPVIRAANTGFSAVIDPHGRILYRSELYKEEAVRHALPMSIKTKKSMTYLSMVVLLVTLLAAYYLQYIRLDNYKL